MRVDRCPETVARKIVDVSPALGGLSRFTLQMTNAMMVPESMLRSIELLGTEVALRVRAAMA